MIGFIIAYLIAGLFTLPLYVLFKVDDHKKTTLIQRLAYIFFYPIFWIIGVMKGFVLLALVLWDAITKGEM